MLGIHAREDAQSISYVGSLRMDATQRKVSEVELDGTNKTRSTIDGIRFDESTALDRGARDRYYPWEMTLNKMRMFQDEGSKQAIMLMSGE